MQMAFISNWWSISKNKTCRLDKVEGNVAFSRILLWMNERMNDRMIYFFTIFFFYSTTFQIFLLKIIPSREVHSTKFIYSR